MPEIRLDASEFFAVVEWRLCVGSVYNGKDEINKHDKARRTQANFFSGQIVEQTGDRIKVSLAPDLVLEARTQAGIELNRETIFAVRPEKIFLSAQRPNGFNAVPAKVLHRVYMGTSTNYILQPVVGERINVFSQNESRQPAFSVNDKVYAAWEMDSIFLLNE